MTTGACGWTPLFDSSNGGVCPSLDNLPSTDNPAEPGPREQIIQAAADLLWAWTGRVFGVCEVTVRPCRQGGGPSAPSTFEGHGPYTRIGNVGYGRTASPWLPVQVGGHWRGITCGSCAGASCGCEGSSLTSIGLPGPVQGIVAVEIDGALLPADAYHVTSHRFLNRKDGGGWPPFQDLSAELGEPGTWAVTYLRGVPLPVGGRLALGSLACELALAYAGDEDCSLPQRVQSVTRQGVTVALMDSFADLDEGRTGIWEIDSWIASVTSAPSVPAVRSPDYRGPR